LITLDEHFEISKKYVIGILLVNYKVLCIYLYILIKHAGRAQPGKMLSPKYSFIKRIFGPFENFTKLYFPLKEEIMQAKMAPSCCELPF